MKAQHGVVKTLSAVLPVHGTPLPAALQLVGMLIRGKLKKKASSHVRACR